MSYGGKIDMDSEPHILVQASPFISVVIVIIISLVLSLRMSLAYNNLLIPMFVLGT